MHNDLIEVGGHRIDAGGMRKSLREWGRENFRDFPWRHTKNLYHLLIAEFMLLRTQAPQVVPVYEAFLKRFPDVNALSRADRSEVVDQLYSLGLTWRAEYVHETAIAIVQEYNGEVPYEMEKLMSLPGVSQYIAAAVKNFGLEQAESLIDTNTVRIAGRLFGIQVKDSSRRSKLFRNILGKMLDTKHPREYNFALLDLGAQVCTKKPEPDCVNCPILSYCHFGTSIS